jgi:hypothetical protein
MAAELLQYLVDQSYSGSVGTYDIKMSYSRKEPETSKK